MTEVNDTVTDNDNNGVGHLVESTNVVTVKLKYNGEERVYTQKKLSFMRKIELFAHLGNALDAATSGENGISLSSIIGSGSDEFSADVFIQGIAKVSIFAPDVLGTFFCIVLDIPADERGWAAVAIDQSTDDGGLSDDDALRIVETFFDQNAGDIRDFFENKIKRLQERWRTTFGQGSKGSSKRSKSTQRTTQKK